MDLDDELRRAGDELDAASRAHRPPSGTGSDRTRRPWAAVAAAVVVLAVGVGAAALLTRGTEDSDSIVPVTDATSATSATETSATETSITETSVTPVLTDPPTTAPAAEDTGYRCLESEPVDVAGIEFSIDRQPTCSATNMVMLRMGGTASVECSGPPSATLSSGESFAFSPSDPDYWEAAGSWRIAEGAGATPAFAVPYLPAPNAVRPIVLPDERSGALAFIFQMTCRGERHEVSIPFVLSPAVPSSIQVVRVDEDAQYYGACGNETATFSGEQWYPLLSAEQALVDPGLYPAPVPPASGLRAPRVMPPGPGDDVGTFVVYSDGLGRYESDSGRVIWLTRDARQFGWVC